MEFYNMDVISAKQFERSDIETLIDLATTIEQNKKQYSQILQGKVMATLFFEPSTRTRLSFESAMLHLGGRVMGFSEAGTSSVKKGETLADTIRTVANYADTIVIRHKKEGAAKLAQEFSDVPIINAGNGSQEHPTQGLLDLLTIKELKGSLDNLNIGLIGDLKYGRTVHSLAHLLSNFDSNLFFISPEQLRMQYRVKDSLTLKGTNFIETQDFHETLPKLDVIYMTRIQKERFGDLEEYDKVKDLFILTKDDLKQIKQDAIILHPLPRVNEIDPKIDSDPRAQYFKQTYFGLMMRKAILASILLQDPKTLK
ncbi:MAG: aspartate carbamoyltransferase [Candidatus Lokiarchaeota archaeon]|nr:aspartate carbamoyltransferase [Candidatus Harpocratesius repetitus]